MSSPLELPSTRARAKRRPPPNNDRARPKASRPSLLLVCAMWVFVLFNFLPQDFNYAPDPLATATAASTMPTEGSPLTRAIWLALLVFGLGVAAIRYSDTRRLLQQTNRFFLCFMVLCLVSVAWSIAPDVTIRRFVRILTIASDALAFALLARSPANFQSVLRPILTTFLIGSIIFVLTDPQLAIEQAPEAQLIGAWHGLAPQKNALGSTAAIALLLWLHGWLSGETSRWKASIGLAVSAICLVKSRSSTSLMATVFAGGLLLVLLRSPAPLKRYMPYLITLFVCAVLVYSLAVLDLLPGSGLLLSPITALTGKDLTFSGRTAIWQIIEQNIALHPWLGGGYGAYWTGLRNSPSMVMLQSLYYYPTESHNGYLDVINDLGYAGLACLAGYVVVYVSQGIRIFAALRSQGALYLTLLFDQLIGNLSEAHWFNALSTEFMIMTIATLAMSRVIADRQRGGVRRPRSDTTRPHSRPLSQYRHQ